jgi:WD40 repeat protein
MFDFGGMKRDMRSFRKLEPTEGYPVNALSFSPSGALPSGTRVQQRLSESGSLCGALQSCAWRDAGLAMQPADSCGAHLPGCIVGDTAAQGYGKALATKSTVISTDCIPGRRCLLSRAGDAFLVVSGSSQPKVYDRDGHELGEFPKGDMYIRDATHTKGHQYRCCGGAWHPDERCAFQLHPTCDGVLSQCCCQKFDMSCGQMRQHRHCKGWTFTRACDLHRTLANANLRRYTAVTCSEDGTVRIWDCENLKQKTVLKPTLRRAGRVAINAVVYNTDGSVVAGGLMDGSIQLWDVRGGSECHHAFGAC